MYVFNKYGKTTETCLSHCHINKYCKELYIYIYIFYTEFKLINVRKKCVHVWEGGGGISPHSSVAPELRVRAVYMSRASLDNRADLFD